MLRTEQRLSPAGAAGAVPTIELSGVTKVYRPNVRALSDVSFRIAAGERACLLGPNGAGKTTIIRLLNGAIAPTAGQVRLCGVVSGSDDFVAAKRRVGVVPQGPGMYDDLSTREYLDLVRRLYGRGGVAAWAERFGLGPYLDRPLAQLSGGFQRRVSLAAALLAEPEVLLLDEPTVGLDPLAAREVRGYLRDVLGGRTVLLCTHNLAEAEDLCQNVVIIRKGEVLLHENIESLRHRFPVRVHLEARQGGQALAAGLQDLGLKAEVENGGCWLTMSPRQYQSADAGTVSPRQYQSADAGTVSPRQYQSADAGTVSPRQYQSADAGTVPNPQAEIPGLLRRLLGAGLDIYECRVAEASLEDLFVEIVEGGAR